MDLRLFRLLRVAPFDRRGVFTLRHIIQQILSLFEHSKRYPQRFFNLLVLTRQQRGGRERVASVAAIPLDIICRNLPENAATIWTVIGDLLAQTTHLRHVAQDAFCNQRLSGDFPRNGFLLARLRLTSVSSKAPIPAIGTQ
jgi:hypothetical protein